MPNMIVESVFPYENNLYKLHEVLSKSNILQKSIIEQYDLNL